MPRQKVNQSKPDPRKMSPDQKSKSKRVSEGLQETKVTPGIPSSRIALGRSAR